MCYFLVLPKQRALIEDVNDVLEETVDKHEGDGIKSVDFSSD